MLGGNGKKKKKMDIREFLESISPEEIEHNNREQLEENQKFFEDFKAAYSKDCCSLCGNRLDYFSKSETCFHWFTMPIGIKKKDFEDYLSEPIDFFRLESYFRWMASMEYPLKNINDLSDEVSESKIKEVTIKFKNIEWALNYGKTDLSGHENSKNANFPHFHLQVQVDNKPFIRFNDFHIPFSDADLFNIEVMKKASDLVDFRYDLGEGMSFIEDPEKLKELDKIMKVADNEDTAPFHTTSVVQMPDGKTMSGDILEQIFQESRETKIPIRHLVKKYYPEVIVSTQVFPGEGVPEMKKRNKR